MREEKSMQISKEGQTQYERERGSAAGIDEDIYKSCRIHQALLDAEAPVNMCRCPEFCPVDNAMDIFSGKWTVKTLYALLIFGKMRFGELQRRVSGISKPMLSSTLKTLEEHGLVFRRQYNEIPPRVEYSLTEGGEAMQSVFAEIARWSSKYLK